MALLFASKSNKKIYAISVPQSWASPTGPTWVYLLEDQGVTMIDSGGAGSFAYLTLGLERIRFSLKDIDRVIVTHGHWDHDGLAAELTKRTNAEVWTHDIYSYLAPYAPRELLRSEDSEFQRQIDEILENDSQNGRFVSPFYRKNGYTPLFKEYFDDKQTLKVAKRITDGDTDGGLTFTHTPGHSPDHLCISFEGLVFTGDHILPEITPHPTMKVRYPDQVRAKLPQVYRQESDYWGLLVYLKSLKKMSYQNSGDQPVLPAHRLFNKGKLNLTTIDRAHEIIEHHEQRLSKIVRKIGDSPTRLEDVTRNIFSRRKLIGGNLYPAFREVVSHIELLIESGDLERDEAGKLRWKGTENFRQVIAELRP